MLLIKERQECFCFLYVIFSKFILIWFLIKQKYWFKSFLLFFLTNKYLISLQPNHRRPESPETFLRLTPPSTTFVISPGKYSLSMYNSQSWPSKQQQNNTPPHPKAELYNLMGGKYFKGMTQTQSQPKRCIVIWPGGNLVFTRFTFTLFSPHSPTIPPFLQGVGFQFHVAFNLIL